MNRRENALKFLTNRRAQNGNVVRFVAYNAEALAQMFVHLYIAV